MKPTRVSSKSRVAGVIGIDLAKDHCDVVGYGANNKICIIKCGCSYPKLMEMLANMPSAVVLMEACKGSMFRARAIANLGHDARLYYVSGTIYVFIKNEHQQTLQFLQNEYKSLQDMRINVGNQIHAGLEEFGYLARKSSVFIKNR